MEYGMPVLIENKTLEDNIRLCKEVGFSFLELNMNLPEYQIEKLEKTEFFRDKAMENNLYFTIHLDENLNVADFNQSVSAAYFETVRRTIAVAEKINAPILNMHMNHGVHFTLPDRKVQLFEEHRDEYLKSFLKFKKMCEQEIGNSNIRIGIENTDGFRSYEKEAIELLLESDVFVLTWDIGHSNSCGNLDEAFILTHEDRLCHFHIHDSKGTKDHMTLGTGEIDLAARLQIAKKHHCRCVVETKTIEALRNSREWMKEHEKIFY